MRGILDGCLVVRRACELSAVVRISVLHPILNLESALLRSFTKKKVGLLGTNFIHVQFRTKLLLL